MKHWTRLSWYLILFSKWLRETIESRKLQLIENMFSKLQKILKICDCTFRKWTQKSGLLYIMHPHEKSSIRQCSQTFGVQFHRRMYQLENPLQFNKWPIVTLSNSAIQNCRHNIIKRYSGPIWASQLRLPIRVYI